MEETAAGETDGRTDEMPAAERAEATTDEATTEQASTWLRLQGAIVGIAITLVVWLATWLAMGRTVGGPLKLEQS